VSEKHFLGDILGAKDHDTRSYLEMVDALRHARKPFF
jgi:hypothetical protein